MPLIVLGDFNADYRDPRPIDAPNPGLQPVVSEACPISGSSECNAYQTMIDAGFANASPDAKDPKFFSWGAGACWTAQIQTALLLQRVMEINTDLLID